MEAHRILGVMKVHQTLIGISVILGCFGSQTAWSDNGLELTVVDAATKQPVAGARIEPSQPSTGRTEPYSQSNEQGKIQLTWTNSADRYRSYQIHTPGYLSVRLPHPHLLAAETTVALTKAKQIGGSVIDESGSPIEGARVEAFAIATQFHRAPHQHVLRTNRRNPAVTDDRGRWQAEVATELTGRIQLTISHPNYCNARADVSSGSDAVKSPLELLFNQHHQTTLVAGTTISGTVTDSNGHPIESVEITAYEGELNRPTQLHSKTTTDPKGRFKIHVQSTTESHLSLQKDGFTQLSQPLSEALPDQELDIKMNTGRMLRIRVTDLDGVPIPEAYISPLNRNLAFRPLNSATDGTGIWQSGSLPDHSISLEVLRAGFRSSHLTPRLEQTDVIEVQLTPTPTITFTVADAKTGQFIPEFAVTPGNLYAGMLTPHWEHYLASQGRNGRLENRIDRPLMNGGSRVFLISAENYLPKKTEPYGTIDRDLAIHVELEEATPIRGWITTRLGSAPREAIVVALNRNEILGVISPGYQGIVAAAKRERKTHALAENDGQFRIFPGLDTAALIVASESGFALVNEPSNTTPFQVELAPYAQVSGFVRGISSDVSLRNPTTRHTSTAPLSVTLKAAPNELGAYHFHSIPPGTYEIGRSAGADPTHAGPKISVQEKFDLATGEQRTINIGGTGRFVRGQAILTGNAEAQIDWSEGYYEISLSPPVSEIPQRSQYDSDQAFEAAMEKTKAEFMAYAQTEAGRKFLMNRKEYPLKMESNGVFESTELPPGRYSISLRPFTWEWISKNSRSTADIGSGHKTVTVPAGYSDEPLDVGVVEVEPRVRLPIGALAPGFTLPDQAGDEIKLADYRGKFVFLDFWSTTCGPCIAEMPYLREAYETFQNHPDFVMIALSLDEDWKTIDRFKRREPMPWKHLRVGPFKTSKILDDYGVFGIPSNFLISPEGIVLRKEMRGHAVQQALEEFLPKQ